MINNYFLYLLLEIVNHPCAKEMFFSDEDINFMYNMIDNNNIIELQNLLDKDPTKAKRLFFYSLFHEKSNIAFLLLDYIKDVNEKFFLDNCFLQASTQFNNLETTHKLLKMGADPNPDGHHPLINSINNYKMFDLLIKYGSDIKVVFPFINRINNEIFNRILIESSIENLYTINHYNKNIERKKIIKEKINECLYPISELLKKEDIIKHIETFLSIS